MSSSSSDDVVAAYQELSTTNYIGWAAFVLPLYDWLLCLGQEVNLVWARPKARPGASLLYLLNRYPLMVSYIIAQFLYIPISNERILMLTSLEASLYQLHAENLPVPFNCSEDFESSTTWSLM
ncbi:hypothetical protein BD414DRAFT_506766 [Trametes punicea]|nr:hypothetical protein BD414DRAFT_506766 [Trametes punicea]